MQKQTSPLLLRLGINRGWNLNFLGNLKFYSFSLKQCLFLFLLLKSQLIKKNFWLIVQFIFFNFKKCIVKLFFWQFFSKLKKKNKIFQFLKKKKSLILKKNIFLKRLEFKKKILESKRILNLKKSFKLKNFNFFFTDLQLKKKISIKKKKIFLKGKKRKSKKKKLILSYFLFKKSKRSLNFHFLKKGFSFLLNKKLFLNTYIKSNNHSFWKGQIKSNFFSLKSFFKKFFSLKSVVLFNFFKKYSLIFFKRLKFNNFFEFLRESKNLNLKRYFKFRNFKEVFEFNSAWYALIALFKLKVKSYLSFFNFFNFILVLKKNNKNNKSTQLSYKNFFYSKDKKIACVQILQQIYLKIWQYKLKNLIANSIPGEVKIIAFDIIKVFRKSKKRSFFEKTTIATLAKKLPFFAKALVSTQPLLVFNLIKLFGLVFKIIGTTHILTRYFSIQIKMIRKHWHFLRLVKLVLNSYWKEYSDKVIGCRIGLIGKINGSNRTRKIIIDAGFLNVQRFSSLLDYSLAESFSLFGIFGIKIWLQFF